MSYNLGELGKALGAFLSDLGPSLADVTLITLTEFGRTVHENGDNGWDHGHGSAVLVAGGGVNGGAVYGTFPGCADAQTDDNALVGTTDYRDLLAEILARRVLVGGLSTVFPGFTSAPLGIVATRSAGTPRARGARLPTGRTPPPVPRRSSAVRAREAHRLPQW